MKKSILILVLLFGLTGCMGSMNHTDIPFSIETEVATHGESPVVLLDRKITSMVLDVSQKGFVQLNIRMTDELQINNKRHYVSWKIKIRLDENAYFKIHK